VGFCDAFGNRDAAAGRHSFTHPHRNLTYDGAAHAITFPYTPSTITEIFHPAGRSLMAFGGTPKIPDSEGWSYPVSVEGEEFGVGGCELCDLS
jgi:bile acid acyltransferase/acyl-CoA thioester hydrolase-like protein